MSGDYDADEEDFLMAIVASERIERWLDLIKEGKKRAIFEMLEAMRDSPAYAEEARRAGAVSCMTSLIKSSQANEEEMDAAASIISICSGMMACGGKIRSFDYGAGVKVTVREGALGDGLGSKVWSVSHALSRLLVSHPELVRDKKVLEIGAGCGINGIVAAKLGAAEVILSDVEPLVLDNCARCMLLNHDEGDGRSSERKEDHHGEILQWECGNVKTRFLDWAQSLHHLDQDQEIKVEASEEIKVEASRSEEETRRRPEEGPFSCPSVPIEERFGVVLGNEVLYEPLHARLVAAVVAHKLQQGGCCLLCCAVRDLATFSVFRAECAKRCLVYRDAPFELSGERGLMGKVTDYEGFLLIMVDFASKPFLGKWPSPEALSS